ncbi:hypothetical protein CEXT_356231 [Caerostris extrusa]|uniref:Uncharacterized protein n=1 Tax=Caerostris extrusa TaxID=172846 RepID=A0AAV4W7E3_CAEEX|nr:hypothetical protein CEXT_356231 [Caerostris extrusa]
MNFDLDSLVRNGSTDDRKFQSQRQKLSSRRFNCNFSLLASSESAEVAKVPNEEISLDADSGASCASDERWNFRVDPFHVTPNGQSVLRKKSLPPANEQLIE